MEHEEQITITQIMIKKNGEDRFIICEGETDLISTMEELINQIDPSKLY